MLFLDNKICFIHIPKTAGTFLRDFLKSKKCVLLESWNCKDGYDYAHLPIHKLNMIYNDAFLRDYKYFAVIRNPYDRFISAFFDIKKRGYAIVKNKNINKFIQSDLRDLSANFDTFNKEFVHIIPQYKFICTETGDIDSRVKLLRYHRLQEDLFALLYIMIPFRFKGYKVKEILTLESMRIIDEIYAKDFEMLAKI